MCVCIYVCMDGWVDGYRQMCMNICMYMYVKHMYTYIHTCLQNVIPGNMSFN